jgi:hypothetical protein
MPGGYIQLQTWTKVPWIAAIPTPLQPRDPYSQVRDKHRKNKSFTRAVNTG